MDDQNLSGCCVTSLEPMDRVSCGNPIGAHPEGHPRPKPHIFSSRRRHIRVFGFGLDQVFLRETVFFIVTVMSSPFAVNHGPRSCSTPLAVAISPFVIRACIELYFILCFIYICNFRL